MSEKCEGCPITYGVELVEIKGYGHCGRSLKGGDYHCHLTRSDFTAIKQAIVGEGRLVFIKGVVDVAFGEVSPFTIYEDGVAANGVWEKCECWVKRGQEKEGHWVFVEHTPIWKKNIRARPRR